MQNLTYTKYIILTLIGVYIFLACISISDDFNLNIKKYSYTWTIFKGKLQICNLDFNAQVPKYE